jgi:hypothetical protein
MMHELDTTLCLKIEMYVCYRFVRMVPGKLTSQIKIEQIHLVL